MSILCSERLDDIQIPCDAVGNRLLMTRATLAGRRFAIVNYHGFAQGQAGSPDDFERGGIASEARWRIDDHARNDSVIVLGDFNADRASSEIASLHCFSFAAHPMPRSLVSHNRHRAKLCAADIQLPPGIGGTFWWSSATKGYSWRTLDFIVVGPNLSVQTKVLDILDGIPLTDGTKPITSDHLPVAGTMDLT